MKYFLQLKSWLIGKKTYFLAIAGAIVVLLNFFHVIDPATANVLLGLLGFGTAVALRAGIGN